MVIDAHCHIFERFEYMEGLPVNKMVDHMTNVGIDKAVIFTLEGLFHDFKKYNNEIAKVASYFPERLIPFGTFNPWYGKEVLDEIDRCVDVLGMRGFKLHPWMSAFPINSELMHPIIRKIEKLDIPLIIHSGTPPWSEPFQISEIAESSKQVKFIMAHMGLPDLWKEAIVAAEHNSNIFLETSGAHSLSIIKAIERVGVDRIVFGSDMPFGGKENVVFQKRKIEYLDISDNDKKKILGENIANILQI